MNTVDIRVAALPMSCREQTVALLRAARAVGLGDVADAAVLALAEQIDRSRDEAAACRVDRDRGIRQALETAGDCQWHAAELRRLSHSVYAYNILGARCEEERGIWLSASFRLREALKGRTDDVSRAVVDALTKTGKAVDAARRRYQSPSEEACEKAGGCDHKLPPVHAACEQLRLDLGEAA